MIIKKELLFTVDEFNDPIKPMPRDIVHRNGIWHRTNQIWIINDKKQVLCQRRSLLKDMNPGKWEALFGGHVLAGQESTDNAINELKEELGIEATQEDLHFFTIYKSEQHKEFESIYYFIWYGNTEDVHLEQEEVDQVKWFTIDELIEILVEKKDPSWSAFGYEDKLLSFLKNKL